MKAKCRACEREIEVLPDHSVPFEQFLYPYHSPGETSIHGYVCPASKVVVYPQDLREDSYYEIFFWSTGSNHSVTVKYNRPQLDAETALGFVRVKFNDPEAVVWIIAKIDVITIEEEK